MKIVILIEGEQNSGKTSTIKEIINNHSKNTISVMRRGWQRIWLNSQFPYLNMDVYCVPASPSETNIKLTDRFAQWMPDVLILAEQRNGQHYSNTYSFLTRNNYIILRYQLTNSYGKGDWERFDNSNKSIKLNNRANAIINDLRLTIRNNNLI